MTDWGWWLPPGVSDVDVDRAMDPRYGEYDPPELRCMACDRRITSGWLCATCKYKEGEMAKYRKRPVVIEAWRLPGLLEPAGEPEPEWIKQAEKDGTIYLRDDRCFIKTLEGEMEARVGDYIIKGVKGELYSCKRDIFLMTYEPVEA